MQEDRQGALTREPALPGEAPVSNLAFSTRLIMRQEFWITIAVLAIGLAVSLVTDRFATYNNLSNIFQNFCFIGILAIGMTPVLISGGIDISVGTLLGLTGICLGMMLEADVPLWLGMCATLALGTALGSLNGLLIAYLRLPPFLVTLGMLSIGRSMAFVISDGQAVYSFGASQDAIIAIGGGKMLGVANIVYALLVCAILLQFLLSMTRWGRYVAAVGGNERAARLTGLPVKPIKVSVYAFSGLMAGITAIFLVGWLGSITNSLGQGDELRVIAGTVIGGASLAGGYGTAYGAVIGSLLIEVIRNGLLLAGVNPFWQGTFVGGFIILAIVLQRLHIKEED